MQTYEKPAASGRNVFHVAKDMLPPGEAEKLKPGDKITMQCVSPMDNEGDVAMECCSDGDMESPQEDMAEGGEENENSGSWEEQARAELSPQAPENEA